MEKFENIIDFLRALIFSVAIISSVLFAIDYYLVKNSEKKKEAQEEKIKNIPKKTISEEKKEVKKEELKINYKEKEQETKKVMKEEKKENNTLENFLTENKIDNEIITTRNKENERILKEIDILLKKKMKYDCKKIKEDFLETTIEITLQKGEETKYKIINKSKNEDYDEQVINTLKNIKTNEYPKYNTDIYIVTVDFAVNIKEERKKGFLDNIEYSGTATYSYDGRF